MEKALLIVLLNLLQIPTAGNETGCTATDSLTVRNAHAMAYNTDQAAVLLFGGADERQVLADLWAWNGTTWRCLSNGGPPPRTFATLAYDRARKRLLLFGGNRVLFGTAADTATFLDDMWAWNGEFWHQVDTRTPPARAEASMVYDKDRQRVVLFGGYHTVDGEIQRLSDTWEWDGQHWEHKSDSGPSPRHGAAMAYDSQRKRVVLFGGNGASGETWEWDGQHWEQTVSAQAEGRFNSAMAYDAKRRAIIRFGGWNGDTRVADTWSYEGIQWRRLTSEGPVARNHTALVYDQKQQMMVLFGGHDGSRIQGDMWAWDGEIWSQIGEQSPLLRVDNGH